MPTHTANPVFLLSQAADILGMPQSRLKNWTNGRPLKISPSIGAQGTGSRNLYDRSDLYRLAVASQLNQDGFAARAIQLILDQLGTDFGASKFALVTTGDGRPQWKKGGQLHVQVVSSTKPAQESWQVVHGLVSRYCGCYVLNISKITTAVDGLTEQYVKGSVGIYRSVEKAPAKEELDMLRRTRKYNLEK